jgi:hypothetical protein
VLTPTYGLASTLSLSLPGQPATYCLSWNFGMTANTIFHDSRGLANHQQNEMVRR